MAHITQISAPFNATTNQNYSDVKGMPSHQVSRQDSGRSQKIYAGGQYIISEDDGVQGMVSASGSVIENTNRADNQEVALNYVPNRSWGEQ
jgi:hypothetical protein